VKTKDTRRAEAIARWAFPSEGARGQTTMATIENRRRLVEKILTLLRRAADDD